jgi:N-carbamoyl-L-amino-acid hydrolase
MLLQPDLVNVVPKLAVLSVDLRNSDEAVLREAERGLAARAAELAAAEGVTVEARRLARFEPVSFDERVVSLVERTARTLGHRVRRIPSGAGHDAQMLARMCPTGMVFVPSVAGISHNPAEHTHPDHLVAGADVLLHTIVALAGADEAPGEPTRSSSSSAPTTAPSPAGAASGTRARARGGAR